MGHYPVTAAPEDRGTRPSGFFAPRPAGGVQKGKSNFNSFFKEILRFFW